MQNILNTLESTMNKSAIMDFRLFIKNFNDVSKWVMCSDYCIDDRGKPNDVMTFVLYPFVMKFNDWFSLIDSLQKTDLKECRSISKEFSLFSHSGYFFCFNFILAKDSPFRKWREPEFWEQCVDIYIHIIKNEWKTSMTQDVEHYCSLEKRLIKLKNEMSKKNFNYKLLSRILIMSVLASYLRYLLFRETNVEIFSWLSDRDKMTGFCDSIYEVLYEIIAHILCFNNLPEEKYLHVKELKLINIEENMYYDEFVRVADFLCGAVADQDIHTGKVHKQKHCTLIEEVIADNPNIITFLIGADSISRISHKKYR